MGLYGGPLPPPRTGVHGCGYSLIFSFSQGKGFKEGPFRHLTAAQDSRMGAIPSSQDGVFSLLNRPQESIVGLSSCILF